MATHVLSRQDARRIAVRAQLLQRPRLTWSAPSGLATWWKRCTSPSRNGGGDVDREVHDLARWLGLEVDAPGRLRTGPSRP